MSGPKVPRSCPAVVRYDEWARDMAEHAMLDAGIYHVTRVGIGLICVADRRQFWQSTRHVQLHEKTSRGQ